MKTKMAFLGLFTCAWLQAQPDIGMYPSTTWASTNLLVNRSLEAGAAGQAIGYSAAGVVGPITVSGGGGGAGQDTNAVAAVPDLATLTNTVMGYQKAIVGQANDLVHKLFQRVAISTLLSIDDLSWGGGGTSTEIVPGTDGSVIVRNSDSTSISIYRTVGTTPSTTYIQGADIKANESSTLNNLTAWGTPTWLTPTSLSMEYAFRSVTFTTTSAATQLGIYWARSVNSTADYLEIKNWRYNYGSVLLPYADGVTVFASAAEPGYGWQQVSLESPGGGGTGTKTYQSLTTASSQIFPNSDMVVINSKTDNLLALTAEPVIPAGTDYQLLRVVADWTSPDANVSFTADSDTNPATGSNIELGVGVSWNLFINGWIHDLLWDPTVNRWVLYGTTGYTGPATESSTLLPAPWPPPDADGIQLLPANVKRQLIVELLPYMASNWTEIVTYLGTNAVATP